MWVKHVVVDHGNGAKRRMEFEELLRQHFPDTDINQWTDMAPLRPGTFGVSWYQTRQAPGEFETGIRVELPAGTDLDTEVKVQALLEQFCAEHPGTRLTN